MAAKAAGEVGFESPAEFREVLGRLLEEVDADERIGPLVRAAHVRTRFLFSDLGLTLDLASAAGQTHYVEWRFGRAKWEPKVTLSMDSGVANRWLQGRESLAVAIARGRVRCVGEAKSTLFFLPLGKLLADPYRKLIAADYRHLELD